MTTLLTLGELDIHTVLSTDRDKTRRYKLILVSRIYEKFWCLIDLSKRSKKQHNSFNIKKVMVPLLYQGPKLELEPIKVEI